MTSELLDHKVNQSSRSDPFAAPRSKSRSNKIILITLLSFLAISAVAIMVLHSSIFAARNIKLEGNTYLSRGEILAMAKLSSATPLFDINTSAVESSLDKSPWITSSHVAVLWPSKVLIKVSEARPIGFIRLGASRYDLVGSDAKLLEELSSRPGYLDFSLPASSVGRDGNLTSSGFFALKKESEIISVAPYSIIGTIKGVNYQNILGVELSLQNGTKVVFGNSSQASEKWVALATMIARTNINKDKEIDLRDPNLPVVTG